MGEPLVLVPAMMADARSLGPVIDRFSRAGPVLVAAPLVGERVEEMASALLDVLPSRAALVGEGLGGIVAMEVLRRAPERVARLALVATSPLAASPSEAGAAEPRMIAAKSGRLADAMAGEVPAEALAPGPGRPAVQALIRDMAVALGPAAYLRQARAMQRRRDQQAALRKARCPVLVLCGAADTIWPVRRQETLAGMIPRAELRVIEAAGHRPLAEAPDEVVAALESWMGLPLVLR